MTTNDWHISAPDNGQGEPPGAKEGMSDAATTLLASEGGAGAELRGHVPDDPSGVVLILHGGAETQPDAGGVVATSRRPDAALRDDDRGSRR